MKTLILTTFAAVLSAVAILTAASCNSRQPNSGIESDIENPATSADTVTSYKDGSSRDSDSMNIKNNSQRMSDGKDSVAGEVTPPNASEQDRQ